MNNDIYERYYYIPTGLAWSVVLPACKPLTCGGGTAGVGEVGTCSNLRVKGCKRRNRHLRLSFKTTMSLLVLYNILLFSVLF